MEMQLHKRHFKEHSNCERNFFWGSIQTWDGWVVSANPTSLVCRAPSPPQDLNMRPIFLYFRQTQVRKTSSQQALEERSANQPATEHLHATPERVFREL